MGMCNVTFDLRRIEHGGSFCKTERMRRVCRLWCGNATCVATAMIPFDPYYNSSQILSKIVDLRVCSLQHLKVS